MNKQTKVWLVLSIALSLLVLGSACSSSPDKVTNKNDNTGGGAAGVYSGATGTITGVITYNGTPPAPRKIDTAADPVCGQANPNLTTDDTIVADGKLANAFIYVKDGTVDGGKKINDYDWPAASAPVTLDQKGCHYTPHVMGIQVGQKLSVTNSDKTTHNIHPTPSLNKEWNKTQSVGAGPIEETFSRPEQLIPVKCNQHPWMKAYIGVTKHPLFAVSGANGTFEIRNVPVGTYTLAAWREGGAKGTEKTIQVTVPANGSAKADFAFGEGAGPATSSVEPSLKMMPAIEFPMLSRKN